MKSFSSHDSRRFVGALPERGADIGRVQQLAGQTNDVFPDELFWRDRTPKAWTSRQDKRQFVKTSASLMLANSNKAGKQRSAFRLYLYARFSALFSSAGRGSARCVSLFLKTG